MADEVFRPRKPQASNPEGDGGEGQELTGAEKLASVEAMRKAVAAETGGLPEGDPMARSGSFEIKGQPPKAFVDAMKAAKSSGPQAVETQPKRGLGHLKDRSEPKRFQNEQKSYVSASSAHLKELLEGLKGSTTLYEEIELPSRGRFYNGENGPENGIVSIRAMTGEEEQILATPRFVRKGQAINMIFSRCMKENYRPENLLTIDRTYMLIYLRGISYSPNYDVEVKCAECEKKFATTIDLNSLFVEYCPDDYGPVLEDKLPTSKLPFKYRLSTGQDEQEITEYRDRRIKMFGDNAADDTLIYRTSVLLEEIDGINTQSELQVLLKNLPISDVAYIRNCINEPPFGVDTNIEIVCPSCLQEFEVDLPLEANFFFPRRKKTKTQA